MRALLLFMGIFIVLHGCNSHSKEEKLIQPMDNIVYGDQGLKLTDGKKISKYFVSEISVHGDSIKVHYVDSPRGYSFYVFSLKDSSWCEFVQEFSITDISFRKPTYTVIEKDIHLNLERKKYPTSILTGNIKAKIQRHHTWTEDFKDTVIIKGVLNCRLD